MRLEFPDGIDQPTQARLAQRLIDLTANLTAQARARVYAVANHALTEYEASDLAPFLELFRPAEATPTWKQLSEALRQAERAGYLTRRQKNPEPDTPPVQEDPAAGVLIAMVRPGLRRKVLDLVDRTNAHSSKPIGESAMVSLLLEAAFQRLEAEGLETKGRALNIAETLEALKRWVTRQKA